jgi:predicted nuclease of restriction endonuclease-like (RecB) superfamily
MKEDITLIQNIVALVRQSRTKVAITVNTELTLLYWQIGTHIKQSVLNDSRAEYGKHIVENISKNLTQEFGKGWSVKQLHHCLIFAEIFDEKAIFSAVQRNLSWTHFKTIMYESSEIKRMFYLEMTATNKWSTRELEKQIDTMLFERTAIATKPEDLIKNELEATSKGQFSLDLIFKNTYVLDFLGLSGNYSENDLENAILNHIQSFIMEMGNGFAFIERQKRISVDGTDYHLDLLFYHRKLKSLVAIDLKLGKFKPQHKGQMELYLRWLERHEMQEGENTPIGLLLCSEGNTEHIELLMLNQNDVRVAQYLTELPSKEWFIEKLHRAVQIAQNNK